MRRGNGQTSVEYMLVISVVVIAVVASAYVFVPEYQHGVAQLSADVHTMLQTGSINGVGFARGNGGGEGFRGSTPPIAGGGIGSGGTTGGLHGAPPPPQPPPGS